MDREWLNEKEEVILASKDHLEEASQALWDYLPETAEELRWLADTMQKELEILRGERLILPESELYEEASA